MGPYEPGYCDTLLYIEGLPYEQYGFSGPAPLFVQVWYPLEYQSSGNTLTYGDFRKRTLPDNLNLVYRELVQQMDASFISYNVQEAFGTYEEIDYGDLNYDEVLAGIKTYPSRSYDASFPARSGFPVIIYHHGSQGLSDENFIMAEYFASKGYLFVSANYHLSYEGLVYGLQESVRNNSTAIKTVIDFARTLTSSDHLFFVGHSWGAQVGWTFLYEPGWADAFVSLETTIEFKTDTNEIKDKWPFVYDVVKNRQEQFPIPILMLANTAQDRPFWFFEHSGTKEMIFASAKKEFGHESYTSAYLMRYFFREQFKQPDADLLEEQVRLYALHLVLIESFFNAVIEKGAFDKDAFRNSFYINIKSAWED
jgi:dienelactone hydrolase